MQDEFQALAIDFVQAGRPLIGQEPVRINGGVEKDVRPIEYINVGRYGRFGNNVYQFLNAYWIAKALKIPTLSLKSFDFIDENSMGAVDIKNDQDIAERAGLGLSGNFYAPYGFEAVFKKEMQSGETFSHMLGVLRESYKGLIARSNRKKSIALHFRSGDVFSAAPHHWYVQPPSSYYISCFNHAIRNSTYDLVELVYEDRLNPAIEVVEADLAARGIVFSSRSTTVGGDIARLLSADCIISSYGSFCEGAAFLSKYLKSYYCFREPSSQSDLRPFSQCWTASLLLVSSVNLYICDDLSFDYIRPRCWQNSAEQQEMIKKFPQSSLRLYKYN